jgi:hypothetical protein
MAGMGGMSPLKPRHGSLIDHSLECNTDPTPALS